MIPSFNQISNQDQQSKNNDSNINSSVHSSYTKNLSSNSNSSSRRSDNINAHSYSSSSNVSSNLLFSPRLNLFQTQSNLNLKQAPQSKTPTFADTSQFISPFNNDDNNQKSLRDAHFLKKSNANVKKENRLNSNFNDGSKFHTKSENLNEAASKSFDDEQNQIFQNKPKRFQTPVSHQNSDQTNDSILNEIERPQRSNFQTKSGKLNESFSSKFEEEQDQIFHNQHTRFQTPISHQNSDQPKESILEEIERSLQVDIQINDIELNQSSSSNLENKKNRVFNKKRKRIQTPIPHRSSNQTLQNETAMWK